MNISTRFDLGQTVYAIASESARAWTDCAFCAASGRTSGCDGSWTTCPKCYGRKGHEEWLPMAWRVEDSAMTVGQVRVEITRSPGLAGEDLFDNYMPQEGDEERYMLVETGVGSGTLWSAENLFASRAAALAACAERNLAAVPA